MPINYANEIEQVYITLAMKFLGDIPFTGPNILLSTAAVFRSVDVATSSLPTWIPDRRADKRCSSPFDSISWDSLTDMEQTWSVSDDNKVLTLTGWRHGVIVSKADEICEISTFKQLSELVHH
jgi:hypothetical protein